jgi:hypothetical protein
VAGIYVICYLFLKLQLKYMRVRVIFSLAELPVYRISAKCDEFAE